MFSGHIDAGGQSHFYMEAQTAVARPRDGKYLDVVCGTQAPVLYQSSIASVLNVNASEVNVICPRVGGAFGAKLTRYVAIPNLL